MQQALAARDIGQVFRLVMREVGASQSRIGAAVGLEQGYVSRVIAGRRVTSIEVLERLAEGFAMPDAARHLLGLAANVPPWRLSSAGGIEAIPSSRSWREDVDSAVEMWRGDVNRREVLRQAAFSSAGYTVPALRWFTAPPVEPATNGRRTVGQPDVGTIREVTATYRRLDDEYGGGHARDAVARYLHTEVAPLLQEGRFDAVTGRALLSATAELTRLAGWQAYDIAEHGIAQRYFVLALDLARDASDDSLGAEILAAMSHQATYLADTTTGVDLARAAGRAAKRAGVPALVAEALVLEAHAQAGAGDSRTCAAALHAAETALDRADRRSDPQWIAYFGEAYLSAKFAHCFRALGQGKPAERFAARSLHMDDRYVRGRAFNLSLLAATHIQQNEPDRAAAVGLEAVAVTAGLKSARAVRYVRDLQHQLATHRGRPAVRRFLTYAESALGRRR
ncbi:helix-turn-helix domain-containing protein [Actinoplanes sp. NPDC049681]|uniref:helix-turn-helix domain-containing protein n=1 Tax=Actinoplanes sp. NPDC049681 TaxID=3363905 RepID=UPI0037AFCB5F